MFGVRLGPRILVALLASVVSGFVFGAECFALEANEACLACHSPSGLAMSKPDFDVGIDLGKCADCHWYGEHDFDICHAGPIYQDYMARQCNDCHHASDEWPYRPQIMDWPTVFTSQGWFQSAGSISKTPQELHAIHVNGSWLSGKEQCAECHGVPGCDACHVSDSGHSEHGYFGTETISRVENVGKQYGDVAPDTYMYATAPTSNYDRATAMFVGKTGSGEERILLRLPIAKVAGADVTAAALNLTRSTGTDFPLRAYRLRRSDWSASQATWNSYRSGSAWGAAGASDAALDYFSAPYAESSSGSFDVTALARAALAENNQYLDLLIVDPAPVTRRYKGFYTSNGVNAAYYPRLELTLSEGNSIYAYGPVDGAAADPPPPYVITERTCVADACHQPASAGTAGFAPECVSCHADRAEPHGYDPATHTAGPLSGTVELFADHQQLGSTGIGVDCRQCHSQDLGALHGYDCAACHGIGGPVGSFDDWDGSCTQGECHDVYHAEASDAHEAIIDCEQCHQPVTWQVPVENCDRCHQRYDASDTVAPVTTSDLKPSYVGTARVIFLATDSGKSGGIVTFHRLDGGIAVRATAVDVPGAGAHDLEFWSVDQNGNEETPHHVVTVNVIADTEPPVTTSDGKASYEGPATITLEANDNGYLGVKTMYYALDGGPAQTGTVVSVAQPASGTENHVLTFWSDDYSGNEEAPHTFEFSVTKDITAPQTDAVYSAYYRATRVGISLASADSGVGVERMYWRWDAGTTNSTPWTNLLVQQNLAQGAHSLHYWSIDKLGNTETARRADFIVDWTPPVIECDVAASYPVVAEFTITATDTAPAGAAGVEAVHYNIDGGAEQTGPESVSVSVAEAGTHLLEYWALDRAGNASTHQFADFAVGDVPPATEGTLRLIWGAGGFPPPASWATWEIRDGGPTGTLIASGSGYSDLGWDGIDDIPLLARSESYHVHIEWWDNELGGAGPTDADVVIGTPGTIVELHY